MGPIFIILGPMGGIHILADGLPRDYELLRGNGVSDASRRHRHYLLGIIFVILYNNIIFCDLFGLIMDRDTHWLEAIANELDAIHSELGYIGKMLCQMVKEMSKND